MKFAPINYAKQKLEKIKKSNKEEKEQESVRQISQTTCPNCNIPMTLHKTIRTVKTPKWTYSIPIFQDVCPQCGNKTFRISELEYYQKQLEQIRSLPETPNNGSECYDCQHCALETESLRFFCSNSESPLFPSTELHLGATCSLFTPKEVDNTKEKETPIFSKITESGKISKENLLKLKVFLTNQNPKICLSISSENIPKEIFRMITEETENSHPIASNPLSSMFWFVSTNTQEETKGILFLQPHDSQTMLLGGLFEKDFNDEGVLKKIGEQMKFISGLLNHETVICWHKKGEEAEVLAKGMGMQSVGEFCDKRLSPNQAMTLHFLPCTVT